jgi:hypothetical protein
LLLKQAALQLLSQVLQARDCCNRIGHPTNPFVQVTSGSERRGGLADPFDLPSPLVERVPHRSFDHVLNPMGTAMRVMTPALGSDARHTQEGVGYVRFQQNVQARNIHAPACPSSPRRFGTTPTRCRKVLLHGYAMRHSTYRTKGQCSETGQTADVVSDDRNIQLVKVATRLNVSSSFFTCRVVAEILKPSTKSPSMERRQLQR